MSRSREAQEKKDDGGTTLRVIWGKSSNYVQAVGIFFGVFGDFFEDLFARGCGCPVPEIAGCLWIEHDPRDIEGGAAGGRDV